MKRGLILVLMISILLNLEMINAAIPLLEFNITNTQGIFSSRLPRRYEPIRSELAYYFNGTTYINLSKIVELPVGGYILTSNNPRNLIVEIDQIKGIVAVRPRPGWFGEETVIIYVEGIGESSVKKVDDRKIIFAAINADELGKVFFDDSLYSLFANRFYSAVGVRESGSVDVSGYLDRDNGRLNLDVGKDVKIVTSFYKNVGVKPRIAIFIDSGLSNYNSKFGHCSNNIRDFDELQVDCGGECLACSIKKTDFTLVYVTLVLAAAGAIVYFAIKLKKPVKKQKIAKISIKDERHGIARQIELLKNSVNENNIDDALKSLSRLIRSYFRNLFHIKYNFTYFELKNEMVNRKVEAKMKERMLAMFKAISRAEYGTSKINKNGLLELINEAVKIIDTFELKTS